MTSVQATTDISSANVSTRSCTPSKVTCKDSRREVLCGKMSDWEELRDDCEALSLGVRGVSFEVEEFSFGVVGVSLGLGGGSLVLKEYSSRLMPISAIDALMCHSYM